VKTQEWTTVDKSEWGRGPWDDEPDKVQFTDEATGLPCLIVRNRGGALCGYVGVPKAHPWHGVDYSGCTRAEKCGGPYCGHGPDVDVHGGLTFADSCATPTEERYRKSGEIAEGCRAEAAKFPKGDSAKRVREWEEHGRTFETWAARIQATSICHLVGPGEPDDVWWFGFDCSHSGDVSPAYDRLYADHGIGRLSEYESYKGIGYVKAQIRSLARQLAAVS
jgi:hypothetical protein